MVNEGTLPFHQSAKNEIVFLAQACSCSQCQSHLTTFVLGSFYHEFEVIDVENRCISISAVAKNHIQTFELDFRDIIKNHCF